MSNGCYKAHTTHRRQAAVLGQAIPEYALVIVFMAVFAVATLSVLGNELTTFCTSVGTWLTNLTVGS